VNPFPYWMRSTLLCVICLAFICPQCTCQAARPELFIQLPHQGPILDADFAPNGDYATAGQDGTVRVWSGESGLLTAVLDAHPKGALACRFDPSGRYLATAGADSHVRVWDTGDYHQVQDFPAKHEVHAVAWSGDGKKLAALDVFEEVFAWNAAGGAPLLEGGDPTSYEKDHPERQSYPFYDFRHSLAFAPDNSHVLFSKHHGMGMRVVALPGAAPLNFPPSSPWSVSSSPGANRVVITGLSEFLVFDGTFSKPIIQRENKNLISPIRISSDGKLAFYTDDNRAFALDTATLHVIFSASIKQDYGLATGKLTAGAISPDSQSILLADDIGNFAIHNILSRQVVRQSPPHPQSSFASFGDDGTLAVFGYGQALLLGPDGHIQNVELGRDLQGSSDLWELGAFQRDKSSFASAGTVGNAQFWDGVTGRNMGAAEKGHQTFVLDLQVSHSDKLGATAACGEVLVFSIPKGAIQQTIPDVDCSSSIAFSSDDSELVVAYGGTKKYVSPLGWNPQDPMEHNAIAVWDLATKQKKLELPSPSPVNQVAISADGRYLASASDDKQVILWDRKNGNSKIKSWTFETTSDLWYNRPHFGLAFSPKENALAIETVDEVLLCSVPSGNVIRRIKPTGAVAFSPDGQRLAITPRGYSRSSVGTTLWDVASGSVIARVFASGEDSYFILDDNGNYISKGANAQIAFRAAGSVYPAEEFDVQYNRPDLVLKKLGVTDAKLIRAYEKVHDKRLRRLGISEASLRDLTPLPEVKITSREVKAGDLVLNLEADDSSGNLAKLLVADNGVIAYSAPIPAASAKMWSTQVIVPLSSGNNRLQISALTNSGRESHRQIVEAFNDQPRPKPDLYVLAVGVSHYRSKQYDLTYADKDATQLAAAVQKQLSHYREVHVTLLTNEHATRQGILQAATALQKAKREDAVLVFLAGHGLVDDQYEYFFGTHDINFGNPSGSGLSWEDLNGALSTIPSRHKLLLMDSCHAGEFDPVPNPEQPVPGTRGAVVHSRDGVRGVNTKSVPANPTTELLMEDFEDLRRGSGTSVIGASAGTEFSYESSDWKNGVFTYAVLDGLTTGKADLNEDGVITVEELKRYSSLRVVDLTHGKQHPVSRGGNADMDFALALPQSLLFVSTVDAQTDATAISPDGRYLSAITNHALRTWDTCSELEVRRDPLDFGLFDLSVNGPLLRITDGNHIMQFPAASGKETAVVVAKRNAIGVQPTFSPDGERFAYFQFGSNDVSKGVLVNSETGDILATWPQPDFKLTKVLAFSPDGSKLAVFTGNGEITIRDGVTAAAQTKVKVSSDVGAMAFSHSNRLLAASTPDNRAMVFDLPSRADPRCIGILDKRSYLPALLFSRDDKLLLAGSSDGDVRFFSVADGSVVAQLRNGDWAYHMALTPDARLLAIGGYRGSVRLWDVSQWLAPKAAGQANNKICPD
jgi:WD40 repeat protein